VTIAILSDSKIHNTHNAAARVASVTVMLTRPEGARPMGGKAKAKDMSFMAKAKAKAKNFGQGQGLNVLAGAVIYKLK